MPTKVKPKLNSELSSKDFKKNLRGETFQYTTLLINIILFPIHVIQMKAGDDF